MERIKDCSNEEELLKALEKIEQEKDKERKLILKLSKYNPNTLEKEFYKGDKKYTDYVSRSRNKKNNT